MEKGIRHNPVITTHDLAYEQPFIGQASFALLRPLSSCESLIA